MQNDILNSLTCLTDDALVESVKSLVARERGVTAQVIAHLAELDTRDVHLREGYDSLYAYCRAVLAMSEWEAYNRIEVARAARRFPRILDLLAQGAIHLTGVKLLAGHLTEANHVDVLEAARGKSKEEVKQIVARLSPRPDVPVSVRKLPPILLETAPATVQPGQIAHESLIGVAHAALTTAPTPVPRATTEPLSPTATSSSSRSAATHWRSCASRRTCSATPFRPATKPSSSTARALDALLVELARKKFADTPRPRPSRGARPGRPYVTAAVRRAVWIRDRGRCAFVAKSGHRCNERRFIEFHHLDPRALGGEATVDQIQLRCHPHNDYEGRLYFGRRRRARQLVPEQVDNAARRATDAGRHPPQIAPQGS